MYSTPSFRWVPSAVDVTFATNTTRRSPLRRWPKMWSPGAAPVCDRWWAYPSLFESKGFAFYVQYQRKEFVVRRILARQKPIKSCPFFYALCNGGTFILQHQRLLSYGVCKITKLFFALQTNNYLHSLPSLVFIYYFSPQNLVYRIMRKTRGEVRCTSKIQIWFWRETDAKQTYRQIMSSCVYGTHHGSCFYLLPVLSPYRLHICAKNLFRRRVVEKNIWKFGIFGNFWVKNYVDFNWNWITSQDGVGRESKSHILVGKFCT